jgi:hypothetical protein
MSANAMSNLVSNSRSTFWQIYCLLFCRFISFVIRNKTGSQLGMQEG